MAEDVRHAIDRRARQPGLPQFCQPLVRTAGTEGLVERRRQCGPVRNTGTVGGEPAIILETRPADRVAQHRPLPLVRRCQGKPAIAGAESLIRSNVGMSVAQTTWLFPPNQVVGGNIRQQRHLRIQERDVDQLPPASVVTGP